MNVKQPIPGSSEGARAEASALSGWWWYQTGLSADPSSWGRIPTMATIEAPEGGRVWASAFAPTHPRAWHAPTRAALLGLADIFGMHWAAGVIERTGIGGQPDITPPPDLSQAWARLVTILAVKRWRQAPVAAESLFDIDEALAWAQLDRVEVALPMLASVLPTAVNLVFDSYDGKVPPSLLNDVGQLTDLLRDSLSADDPALSRLHALDHRAAADSLIAASPRPGSATTGPAGLGTVPTTGSGEPRVILDPALITPRLLALLPDGTLEVHITDTPSGWRIRCAIADEADAESAEALALRASFVDPETGAPLPQHARADIFGSDVLIDVPAPTDRVALSIVLHNHPLPARVDLERAIADWRLLHDWTTARQRAVDVRASKRDLLDNAADSSTPDRQSEARGIVEHLSHLDGLDPAVRPMLAEIPASDADLGQLGELSDDEALASILEEWRIELQLMPSHRGFDGADQESGDTPLRGEVALAGLDRAGYHPRATWEYEPSTGLLRVALARTESSLPTASLELVGDDFEPVTFTMSDEGLFTATATTAQPAITIRWVDFR